MLVLIQETSELIFEIFVIRYHFRVSWTVNKYFFLLHIFIQQNIGRNIDTGIFKITIKKIGKS